MSETPATSSPSAGGPGLSLPASIWGVLTSPRETFADVIAHAVFVEGAVEEVRLGEGAADAVAGHPVGVDADGLGLGPGGRSGGGCGLSGHVRDLPRRERLAAARAGSRYATLPLPVNAPEPWRSP